MSIHESIFTSLHQIDLAGNSIEVKEIDEEDALNYLGILVNSVINNRNKRYFGLNNDSTEVIALIKSAIEKDDYIESSKGIAERLLRVEVKTQEKMKEITELKKGSLVQSLFNYNDKSIYLIAKIEHNEFLDEEDLKKRIGMPYKKIALKTCLIILNEDNEFEDILIHDTNSTLTRYWWDDFLELKEKNTDENNTKSAYNSIKKVLDRRVKRQSPSDYNILFNSLLRYFKAPQSFSIDDVVENVFGEYQPEKPEAIEIDKIKAMVEELPEKNNFDSQFTIIPSEIKDRKRTYNVTNAIELKIKDDINNITDIIKSEINDNNEKFIKIKTDNEETFQAFYHQNK